MSRGNVGRSLLVALFALAIALGGFAGAAMAHADLESSVPAADSSVDQAPAVVEVVFTEEVGDGTTIEVFGPEGLAVHDGTTELDLNDPERRRASIALKPGLPAGTYTVNWLSASTDGHTEEGSFSFTVLVGATASPEASPDASPIAAGIVNEDVVKAQMHEIADEAQQRATVEAASVDRLDEGDFLLAVLAGVAAAGLIYLFWRKVRPSDSERVYS